MAEVRDEVRAERITMLTDLLLVLIASAVAVPLLIRGRAGEYGALTWGLAFAFTAAAALAGALFHGLRHTLPPRASSLLWRTTLYLSVPIGFFLTVVAALYYPGARGAAALAWVALGKLAVVTVALGRRPSFALVAVDAGVSMLVLGAVAAWGLVSGGGLPGAGWVLAGVGVSVVGAVVQQRRWRSDQYVDHNDLFHLAQAAACLLFYLGVGRG